tara:strand:- start:62 stop:682 length:621 start_codon:yes stop_codon:yes gene_type:complete
MTEEEIKKSSKEKEDKLDQETSKDNEEIKNKKKVSLDDKIKELEDKLKRTFAEMENQRRRFEKEKDDAFEYGGFAFAKENLSILDNLERSKQSLENDENLKNTEALKKIIEHLNIIYNDMLSIFKKNNIEPIKSINEKLDPNLHQAMLEIEDETKEVGTIVKEIQKGFLMKDRLLRPSLVGVSKKIKKKEENREEIQQNNQKKDEN